MSDRVFYGAIVPVGRFTDDQLIDRHAPNILRELRNLGMLRCETRGDRHYLILEFPTTEGHHGR